MTTVELIDAFNPDDLPDGIYVAQSTSAAYAVLLAMKDLGMAKDLGTTYPSDDVAAVMVEVGGQRRPARNPSIGVDPHFFSTVLNDYDAWRMKWWREAIQNAVDAGASKVKCSVLPADLSQVERLESAMREHDGRSSLDHYAHIQDEIDAGPFVVSCYDNGKGMTESVMLDKFLVLGGTTKVGEQGATGGFGKAKELLILPWIQWSVESKGVATRGVGVSYEVSHDSDVRSGVRLQVVMPGDRRTDGNDLLEFISRCDLPSLEVSLDRFYSRVRPGQPLVTNVTTKGRLKVKDKYLIDSVEGKYRAYAVPFKGRNTEGYVRTNGLYMFSIYMSGIENKLIIIELDAPSVDVLTANRDGFRDYELKRKIRQLSEELAKDSITRLKRSKRSTEIYLGEGLMSSKAEKSSIAASVASGVGPIVSKGDNTVEMQEDGLVAVLNALSSLKSAIDQDDPSSVTSIAGPELAQNIIETISFRGPTHLVNAVKQLAWKPDFIIQNTIDDFTVPKKFKPQSMTPHVLKLCRVWTEMVRLCLIYLGSEVKFGVGLIFSEDVGGQFLQLDAPWVMINPYKDIRERTAIWSTSSINDLRWMYSVAIHEVTHMANGIDYHDEVFAAALTQNMATCAEGFTKLRAISNSIKTRGLKD